MVNISWLLQNSVESKHILKVRNSIVICICSKNFNWTISFSQTTILLYVNLPQIIFRYVECEEDCKKFLRIVSNFSILVGAVSTCVYSKL